MLNRSMRVGTLVLFLILEGKFFVLIFSFLPVSTKC